MPQHLALVCRSIACDARLLMFHHLARERELPATRLARHCGLSLDAASHHAARLACAGLLERRPSGARVYYSFSPAPRRGRGALGAVVRRACLDTAWATRGWAASRIVHLGPAVLERVPADAARAFDVLFDAATAFTHARRALIVRYLIENGASDRMAMTAALRMSRPACGRHLEKLARRGHVHDIGQGIWRLAPTQKTPVHQAFVDQLAAWTSRRRPT